MFVSTCLSEVTFCAPLCKWFRCWYAAVNHSVSRGRDLHIGLVNKTFTFVYVCLMPNLLCCIYLFVFIGNQVDQNMSNAHKNNAVATEQFYFRRNIITKGTPACCTQLCANSTTNCIPSTDCLGGKKFDTEFLSITLPSAFQNLVTCVCTMFGWREDSFLNLNFVRSS